MSSLRNDSNPLSSASSVASTSSSSMDQLQLPPNKYLMKTLCFNKRSVCMPSKDDYSQLLSCGLGARKWQVCLDLDADTFRCALLNIYPRLSTVTGYTLWALTKDKKFEKLPQKVNTPGRIRAYLGSQFTGCLIIMPTEEISLGPSPISNPVTNGVETDVSLKNGFSLVRDKCGRFRPTFNNSPMLQQQATTLRQFCLLCGRMAKQAGGPSSSSAAAFYNICSPISSSSSSPGEEEEEDGPSRTIASCLRSILRVELPKRRLVPSDDICKRCFRQINEIDYLETQLKNSKDDLIANFLTTISKVGRIESSQAFLPPAAACSINIAASASHSPIHLHPPSPAAPYRAPYMQHPHAEVLGIPQRVFLTPSGSYQRTFDPYSGAVGINYSKERSSSRAGLDDEDEDNRSERMNELSSSPTSDSSCSSSSQGSHGSHGSQGSQGGQEAAGPPRQPWKKRCREIRSAERDVVMQHAKMARQQLQQQAPPVLVARGCSNVDSGHGGSDEDSAASMASDKG